MLSSGKVQLDSRRAIWYAIGMSKGREASVSEKNEAQKLRDWMEAQGITPMMLSRALGIDYTYITRMLSGDRQVSDTLRWRFAMTYGTSSAMRIFATLEPTG